ncbi:MAG: hypothetical protein ACFFBP_17310 [Promethearchaeota archaeon]
MRDVDVKCPFCESESKISIPDEILSQKKFGIFKIEVPSGAACNKHRFIVFIDTQGHVRGYERIDLLMGTSNGQEQEKFQRPEQLTLNYALELVGFDGASYLMHARIFNYPIGFVYDDASENIVQVLKTIGDAIIPSKYRDSEQVIKSIKRSELKTEDHHETFLIDAKKKILNIPWENKVKFEEDLIKKALEIFNPTEQVKLIQREIKNFILRAENANNIMKHDDSISKKDMLKLIAKELRIPRLSKYDLSLIDEFIDRRLSN